MTTGAATRELRAQADDLQGGATKSGFTVKRKLASSPRDNRVVPLAVARAQAGDREAMRYLYLRYCDHVYSYVCTIVGDEHEAEDVTQQVFAKLLTALAKYEERSSPFASWLLKLAHNTALDHLRTRRVKPCGQVSSVDQSSDDTHGERLECLRTALASLSEAHRNVVVLRHMVGLSPTEIADRTGRTESAIHGLHHRGCRILRDELLRMDSGPCTDSGRMAAA
jgi:RNA polymerase sigma-70 factor (ECF subfamily)